MPFAFPQGRLVKTVHLGEIRLSKNDICMLFQNKYVIIKTNLQYFFKFAFTDI